MKIPNKYNIDETVWFIFRRDPHDYIFCKRTIKNIIVSATGFHYRLNGGAFERELSEFQLFPSKKSAKKALKKFQDKLPVVDSSW